MNNLPELLGAARPFVCIDACPILDFGGDEAEGVVGALAEKDAGPFAAEEFYLGFSSESAGVEFATRFFFVEKSVPGAFREFVDGREATAEVEGEVVV